MIKLMMGASALAWCLCLGLTGLDAVEQPPPFSADLMTAQVGGEPNPRPGHVYVSGGKVRIEAPGFADGFFLVDRDGRAAWFVRPRQRRFMDAKQSSPLTQLLVRVDPKTPCRQWQVMEAVAGAASGDGEWHCELLGRDVVDGLETWKYLTTSRQHHRSYRWIDPHREFPVRLEAEDGVTITLQNVVDAPQPSSLFAIPPDYRKFDPLELIEQVKQSDVWVEPPR